MDATTLAKNQVKVPSRKMVLLFSILFMGLGHIIFLKQYIKGFIFAAIEIVFLIFTPMFFYMIYDFVTLGGEGRPDLPVMLRPNSLFMLVDGIIGFAIILVFVIIYVISVKSAMSDYHELAVNKEFKPVTRFFSDLSNKSFSVISLAPSLGLLLLFVVVPIVFSFSVAFTNYSAPSHIPPNNVINWVGFENFITIFGGNHAWTSALISVVSWTLIWAVLATATTYFGGMIMATVLQDSKLKFPKVFRSIFILPYAVPAIISMLIWSLMLNGEFGVVNNTLRALGLLNGTIPWLSDPFLARMMIVLLNLWAGFPYFMLLVTGTMTAIPGDVYEAARIDGADKFQIFRRITFPLVTYMTMPLIIMSFSFNINNFGAIFFLFQGSGPVLPDTVQTTARATDIMITWIFQLATNLNQFQLASTLAVLIFITLAPFAIFNFINTKSFKEGDV